MSWVLPMSLALLSLNTEADLTHSISVCWLHALYQSVLQGAGDERLLCGEENCQGLHPSEAYLRMRGWFEYGRDIDFKYAFVIPLRTCNREKRIEGQWRWVRGEKGRLPWGSTISKRPERWGEISQILPVFQAECEDSCWKYLHSPSSGTLLSMLSFPTLHPLVSLTSP